MISNSKVLTDGVWFNIADNVDYMVQNRSADASVLIKVSDAEPTSTDGSFELTKGGVLASTVVTGNIWATTNSANALIVYAV